jgi:ubiquinone/menaquinone biosynthesis C-methylase UbiE
MSWVLNVPLRRNEVRRIVEQSHVGPGMRVLELGCGPGAITEELARRVEPGGEVVALDIQLEMLEKARVRLARLGVENVVCQEASATSLPFPDETFDAAVMVSVLGEVGDSPAALAEVLRVLKPAGTLTVGEDLIDPHYVRSARLNEMCRAAGFATASFYPRTVRYTAHFRKPAASASLSPG